jgi:hypothetical protein
MSETTSSQTPSERTLSLPSAPVSVSTADGLLRGGEALLEQRLAAVRDEARARGLEGGCGGVGGGWGN